MNDTENKCIATVSHGLLTKAIWLVTRINADTDSEVVDGNESSSVKEMGNGLVEIETSNTTRNIMAKL